MGLYQFKNVVGNTATKNVLMKFLENDKFPNFSIFSGPSGTGKSYCSCISGLRIVCENPNGAEPCGICPQCKAGMDVIRNGSKGRRFKKINIAAFKSMEEVSEMITEVFKIDTGDEKVCYIFEEFHEMSSHGQTALLEEIDKMPSNVHVMICTNKPYQLEDALKRRAIPFKFGSLSPSSMRLLIDQNCTKYNLSLSKATIAVLQSHSRGVPGLLETSMKLLVDKVVSSEDELSDFLKETNPEDLRNLFKSFGDLSEYIKQLESLIEKSSVGEFIRSAKSYLMELSFLAKGVSQRDTYLKRDDKWLAEFLGFENILKIYNEINKLNYKSELSDVEFSFIKCSLVLNKIVSSDKKLEDQIVRTSSVEKSIQSKELRDDASLSNLNQFKKIAESSLSDD